MSEAPGSSRSDPAVAMVATSGPRLPGAAQVLAACGIEVPEKGKVSSAHEWNGTNLIVPFDDAQLVISMMPGPIPWEGLEGPCATSWWWPEAAEVMQSHTHHFLIAVLGGSLEPVERCLLLTKAVSAVAADSDAVGVYWGEGTLVHEPGEFIRQAEEADPENIPGALWIDVRIQENPDESFRCFTTGLYPLGFEEIEVAQSTIDPGELMEFVGNLACYIVNGRVRIPDGDTVGRTATEQFKVHRGPSMYDRPPVLRLEMT